MIIDNDNYRYNINRALILLICNYSNQLVCCAQHCSDICHHDYQYQYQDNRHDHIHKTPNLGNPIVMAILSTLLL
jgi:hypothetical protein